MTSLQPLFSIVFAACVARKHMCVIMFASASLFFCKEDCNEGKCPLKLSLSH
jgi:hypothetical protein